MLKRILSVLGLVFIAGCQSSAPQSVADSQVPPSPAVRRAVIKAFQAGAIRASNLYDTKISSVVLLDPPTKTYAFCLSGTSGRGVDIPKILGISFRDGRIIGTSTTDFRCRDKRLRYYPFPEVYAYNSQG